MFVCVILPHILFEVLASYFLQKVEVAQYYNTAFASLAAIRFVFVLLVGYAGLFRISELLSVKVKDILISVDGMSIFVSQRKND